MSVVYIAGPMTGIPEFNYPAFNAAEGELIVKGHWALNPTHAEDFNPTPGKAQTWEWYMRHALKLVADAEGIALLPGWQESRGAQLEVQVGTALGLDIRPLSDWLTGVSS